MTKGRYIWGLLLLIGVSWSFDSRSEEETILGPVIIKGSRPKPKKRPIQKKVVPVGVGAKEISVPVTNEGIELSHLEKKPDISVERRSVKFGLNPVQNNSRLKVTWGPKRQLHNQTQLRKKSYKFDFSAGHFNDQTKYYFLESNDTPENEKDDYLRSIRPKRKGHYLTSQVSTKISRVGNVYGKFEWDKKNDEVTARNLITGLEKSTRHEYGLGLTKGISHFYAFYFQNTNKYYSRDLLSSNSKSLQDHYGLSYHLAAMKNMEAQLILSQTNLSRDYEYLKSRESFSRQEGTLKLVGKMTIGKLIDLEGNYHVGMAQDTGQELKKKWSSYNLTNEISSLREKKFGLAALGQVYQLVPNTKHLFGDGKVVRAVPNLPSEKGLRVRVGPWLKTENIDIQLNWFAEESKDEPFIEGVSPVSARARAIGGVWTRGLSLDLKIEYDLFEFYTSGLWQTALSTSEVSWEHGRRVPGRPLYQYQIGGKLFWRNLSPGFSYTLTGPTAIDFANEWFRPIHHQLNFNVSYKLPKFLVSIEGNNLLANEKYEKGGGLSQFSARYLPELRPTGRSFLVTIEVGI